MKRFLMIGLLLSSLLAGCLNEQEVGPAGTPSFENVQPGVSTALEAVAELIDGAERAPSAGGIWPYGDYVFGSGLGAGMWIADISDPSHPHIIFNTTEEGLTSFSRDADVVEHPDGRLTLTLATQNDGMHIWDVSKPAEAKFLARILVADGNDEPIPNHNVAVVPGTELVFNSRSRGEGSTNDLVDLSDPAHPVILGTYGTHGCHDISFWGTAGEAGFRAYCAGIDRTEIWDLEGLDIDAPEFGISLVSYIDPDDHPLLLPGHTLLNDPVPGAPVGGYPLRTLHHLAIVNNDASILIIGDEHNGGGAPGMCLYNDPATGASTPLGALWFFDISDETDPVLLSWFSPPTEVRDEPTVDPSGTNPVNPAGVLNNLPSCTAHFGTVVPGEEKLVMAWYNAGVVLVDFSDPAAPIMLDQWTTEDEFVWDARLHHGYVFTGDINRGMDVLKLV